MEDGRKGGRFLALIVSFFVTLSIMCVVGYVKNIIKLVSCDFEAPYKAECIHAAGIVPPVGAITGWLDVGK